MYRNSLNKKYYIDENKKMIYKLTEVSFTNNGEPTGRYALELITGYDYINPDWSNAQGWVSPNNFIDEVQYICGLWYYLEESLNEYLSDYDNLVPLDKLPKIHKIKEV